MIPGFMIKALSWMIVPAEDRRRFRDAFKLAVKGLRPTLGWEQTCREMSLSTQRMHEKAFAEFKGCCTGKDVVIVATGPSLERFQRIGNAVYIGVNRAFKRRELKFDYLFAQDISGLKDVMREMNDYECGHCVKFYGLSRELESAFNLVIPESDVVLAKARRYRTIWWGLNEDVMMTERFAYDLCSQVLASFESVVFPALQFALWMNPRRVYLVGCDCGGSGHFSGNGQHDTGRDFKDLLVPYLKFRDFASRYYPETEIISVNPVGLKGVFKDLFQ